MRNGISHRSWYLLWFFTGSLIACVIFISLSKQFKANASIDFLKIQLSSDGVNAQDSRTALAALGQTPQEAKGTLKGEFEKFLLTYTNSVHDKLTHYQQSSYRLITDAQIRIEQLRASLTQHPDREIEIQVQVKKQKASTLESQVEELISKEHLIAQKIDRVRKGDVVISTIKAEELARQRDRISVHERGLAAVFGARHPRLLSVRAPVSYTHLTLPTTPYV